MDAAAPGTTEVRQEQVPFLEYPSSRQSDTTRQQCLIYLIPGNPGLIAYYEPFMKTLRQLLNDKEATDGCHTAFHIYGRNLLGFDDADHSPSFGTASPTVPPTTPFSLEDQITSTCAQLAAIHRTTLPANRPFDSAILIGHSVGSYITLEVFHRHHQPESPSTPISTVPLKSGILLFPTISHIARSPSGQKLNLLRTTHLLNQHAHHVAKGFVDLCPAWLLGGIVRRAMRFPDHAAEATLRFLASKDGIWQALHMGKDEMATIGEERWGEELWEIQRAEAEGGGEEKKRGDGGSKFYCYFAQRDHWVADESRDEFIERRKRHEKGRTRVVVDEEAGIPHAFCIRECARGEGTVCVGAVLADVKRRSQRDGGGAGRELGRGHCWSRRALRRHRRQLSPPTQRQEMRESPQHGQSRQQMRESTQWATEEREPWGQVNERRAARAKAPPIPPPPFPQPTHQPITVPMVNSCPGSLARTVVGQGGRPGPSSRGHPIPMIPTHHPLSKIPPSVPVPAQRQPTPARSHQVRPTQPPTPNWSQALLPIFPKPSQWSAAPQERSPPCAGPRHRRTQV